MKISFSRVSCFSHCARQFKYRYVDGLKTLPDDKPDNALFLGTALHTAIEKNIDTAISNYYANYPIINDEHVVEAIKLEIMRSKINLPDGIHEVEIVHPDFVGFVDLLVQVAPGVYDIYDFKYSNNVTNYLDSEQLHLYKYFYEITSGNKIRNLYYLFVPKLKSKRLMVETNESYRNRIRNETKQLNPEIVEIDFDPNKVISFLLKTKRLLEETEFLPERSFLCSWCEYKILCEEGEDYMILPKSERRKIEGVSKKTLWIYGAPFSGKTTFANQFPNPLMLNTDGNIKFVDAPFIAIRNIVTTEGRLTETKMAWEVFKESISELEKGGNEFKTVIVDLLEDVHEACRLYMYGKLGIDHESDDSFRAWDKVRTEFLSTMKRLFNMDYENIIVISHEDKSKDIMKKFGDKVTAIKPNIQDKIANKIAGMVDIVGRVIAEDGDYKLSFKTDEVVFGGGRLKLTENEIPLMFEDFSEIYDSILAEKVAPTKPKRNMKAPIKEVQETEELKNISEEIDLKPRRGRRRVETTEEVQETEEPKKRTRKPRG